LTFDFPGYPLQFVQRKPCRDSTSHYFTEIFKFFSPKTKLNYVATAEYYEHNVIGVKFYAKKDKKSDFKYNKIINKGDFGNIVMTIINLVVMLYERDKSASFFFQGAGSVDARSKRVEGFYKTQRYVVYRYIVERKFGNETFQHYTNDMVSGYLIVNRRCGEHVDDRKDKILTMLQATYHEFSVI
jgi:hypothetical protein